MNSRSHQQFTRNPSLTQAVLRVIGAHATSKRLSDFAVQHAADSIAAMAQEARQRGKQFAASNKHSGGRVNSAHHGHANTQSTSRKNPAHHVPELREETPPRHAKPQKDSLTPITESLNVLGKSLSKELGDNDFSRNLADNPAAIMKCLSGLKIKFTQAELNGIIAETIKSAERLDGHMIAVSEFSPHTVTALLLDAIGQHSGKHEEIKQRFLQSPYMAEIIADHHAHALGAMAHTAPSPAMEQLITLQQNRLGDLFDCLREGSRSRATVDKCYAAAIAQAVKEPETPPPPIPDGTAETTPSTYHSLPEICAALQAELTLRLPSVTNEGTRVLHDTLAYPKQLQSLFPDALQKPLTTEDVRNIVDAVVAAHNNPDMTAQEYLGERYLTVVATRCMTDRLGVAHTAKKKSPEPSSPPASMKPHESSEKKDDKKTAINSGSTVTWIAAASLGGASLADFFGIGKAESTEQKKEAVPAKKQSSWLTARNMLRALVMGGAIFLAVQASKGKPIGAATAGLFGRSGDNTDIHR